MEKPWSKRIDPSIKPLLMVTYALYLVGWFENVAGPTEGLLMVVGFSLLISSHAFQHSSYQPHARWLITCTLLWIGFLLCDYTIPIRLGRINYSFHLAYFGNFLTLLMILYGWAHLYLNRPLLEKSKYLHLYLTYSRKVDKLP
ncbi:MAG: hypothetical protein WDW19_01605 [Neisseriaceae bacterium]